MEKLKSKSMPKNVKLFVKLPDGREAKITIEIGNEDPTGVHYHKPEFEEVFQVIDKLENKQFTTTSDIGD